MTGTHIVLIVMAVMGYSAFHSWVKHRHKVAKSDNGQTEDMLSKIDVLEERIRVLERIVTEHNIDLKQQIDNL